MLRDTYVSKTTTRASIWKEWTPLWDRRWEQHSWETGREKRKSEKALEVYFLQTYSHRSGLLYWLRALKYLHWAGVCNAFLSLPIQSMEKAHQVDYDKQHELPVDSTSAYLTGVAGGWGSSEVSKPDGQSLWLYPLGRWIDGSWAFKQKFKLLFANTVPLVWIHWKSLASPTILLASSWIRLKLNGSFTLTLLPSCFSALLSELVEIPENKWDWNYYWHSHLKEWGSL